MSASQGLERGRLIYLASRGSAEDRAEAKRKLAIARDEPVNGDNPHCSAAGDD